MFYKSIFNTVVVAVIAAFFCIGCIVEKDCECEKDPTIPDDNPAGGNGGLVGDWLMNEGEIDGSSIGIAPDNVKLFFSFKSTGEVEHHRFDEYGDIWIEWIWTTVGYSVKGDSMCFAGDIIDDIAGCWKYNISGNNLTLSNSGPFEMCSDEQCYTIPYSLSMKGVRGNIANVKRELGSNLKNRDSELDGTRWGREWFDPDYGREVYGSIMFGGYFWEEGYGDYTSHGYATWYTENSRVTLVVMKEECEEYDGGRHCTFTDEIEKIVPLDYQLTNNGRTLLLRPAGSSEWDEWTLSDRWKTRQEKSKRAISPFLAFRR